MNSELIERLELLREDYRMVTGESFAHFYCPILYRDEPGSLCRGHVLNLAFPDTDRTWTVQRSDVDSFFGGYFESEFTVLKHRGGVSPLEALMDPGLAKTLRPRIRVDGQEVKYYRGSAHAPAGYTPIKLSVDGVETALVLKIAQEELAESLEGHWEIGVERDLRLPALVSMLKAAHLTMFHLLNYRYTFSSAGRFVGRDVLGAFYEQHRELPKDQVLAGALAHFAQFNNMVRPVVVAPDGLQSTVSSRRLYICRTPAWLWAVLVFLRTGSTLHAVLLPVFENQHAVARYLRFIESPEPEFEGYLAEFRGDQWHIAKTPQRFSWPGTDIQGPTTAS